jgi:hypothetical protein
LPDTRDHGLARKPDLVCGARSCSSSKRATARAALLARDVEAVGAPNPNAVSPLDRFSMPIATASW